MNDLIVMNSGTPFLLYRVNYDVIFKLRHRVLRPNLPISAAAFEGDDESETWHFALKLKSSGEVVSCASFMKKPLRSIQAWQLRGMATDQKHQGEGLGRILLSNAEEAIASDTNIYRFWCNARVSAIPFYEKMGWSITSAEFDIPGVGSHREMVKVV